MVLIEYLSSALLLLLSAYLVFRVVVRRVYASRGQLSFLVSCTQLLVFLGYFCFPEVYNPPGWALFWVRDSSLPKGLFLAGLILICLGFLAAFGTMAWFGLKRAFGLQPEGLKKAGPYQFSRNPQILGGYLLVFGTTFLRPSLYALGWIAIYGLIMHWMVLTEEEHLERVFGEEYQQYCQDVPRYIRLTRNR